MGCIRDIFYICSIKRKKKKALPTACLHQNASTKIYSDFCTTEKLCPTMLFILTFASPSLWSPGRSWWLGAKEEKTKLILKNLFNVKQGYCKGSFRSFKDWICVMNDCFAVSLARRGTLKKNNNMANFIAIGKRPDCYCKNIKMAMSPEFHHWCITCYYSFPPPKLILHTPPLSLYFCGGYHSAATL